MFRELLARVRNEVSGARALADVAAVSRFHRVQASPGYDEAARWLEGTLAAAGLEPEREQVPGDGRTRCLGMLMPRGWECRRARAVLVDGAARETLCAYPEQSLSLVLRSSAATGRFALVDVGAGTEIADYEGREVRGRVVLASGPAHRVHRLAVVGRGAAGIVTDTRRLVPPVRRAEDERVALNYTSFWWNEDEARGWGFVVAPETGDHLRARLAAGASLDLEVEIDARDFATAIPLVSTRVGPRGGAEVLVTAHLCHPRTSANDNGSGVAAALETARVLRSLAASGAWRPRHAVRFLWMPELTGTHAWLAGDPERAARTLAALNLDMVGEDQQACGSTLLLEHPPCFSASFATDLLARVRAEAVEWVDGFSGPGHYSMTRMAEVPYSGGSDHVTWIDPAIGVPCPMLIQWPDRFYHSSHDTVDKTDPASLALAARCAATYAGWLAAADGAGIEWLGALVRRGAERRLLAALDAEDAPVAAPRERFRGRRAIESLSRLGLAGEACREAAAGFERFCEERGVRSPDLARGGPVHARRVGAPLDFHSHLWAGHPRLDPAQAEELRRLTAEFPGGTTALDVAWTACDGRRGLAEIAALVALESGREVAVGTAEPGAVGLARFFALTGTLGLSEIVAGA